MVSLLQLAVLVRARSLSPPSGSVVLGAPAAALVVNGNTDKAIFTGVAARSTSPSTDYAKRTPDIQCKENAYRPTPENPSPVRPNHPKRRPGRHGPRNPNDDNNNSKRKLWVA